MVELVERARYPRAQVEYGSLGLPGHEPQYSLHLYLEEAKNVVARHLAGERRLVRLQPRIHMLHSCVDIGGFFVLAILVYAFLYKYLFERGV